MPGRKKQQQLKLASFFSTPASNHIAKKNNTNTNSNDTTKIAKPIASQKDKTKKKIHSETKTNESKLSENSSKVEKRDNKSKASVNDKNKSTRVEKRDKCEEITQKENDVDLFDTSDEDDDIDKSNSRITSKRNLNTKNRNNRSKKARYVIDDDDEEEEEEDDEEDDDDYDEEEDEDEEELEKDEDVSDEEMKNTEEEDLEKEEDVSDEEDEVANEKGKDASDSESYVKEDITHTDDSDSEIDKEGMDDTIKSLINDPKKNKAKSSSKKKKKSINSVLNYTSSKSSKSSKKSASTTPIQSLLSDERILEDDKSAWKERTPVPYSVLCKTLSDIEAITSRLEIQKYLTCLFRRCILKYQKDLITLVYLASNSVAPAYDCVELGVGDAILIKAIGEANGSNPSIIKKKYESEGDLGKVAMNAKGKQRTLGFGVKPKPLMVSEVLSVFRQIATTSGALSQKWKVDKIKGLLVRTQEVSEAKYIIRGLQGKLRIGLAQSTVLISLSHATLLSCRSDGKNSNDDDEEGDLSEDCQIVKNKKKPIESQLESAVNIVKRAYSEVPSFDKLVDSLISVPLYKLHSTCLLSPGLPVEPMLAKPTKSVQEVLKRLNGKMFTCEYKYDGERAQVHMCPDGVTKVFSRSLLDTTEKFPEVPLYVKEACASSNVTSFVLDTEVVAYNRETKEFVPFQILSTRKKTEESEENAKVKVIVQAFDLMFLNGISLLDHTLSERRKLLMENFSVVQGKFQFATALDHKEDGDTALLEEFLETAVKHQCEGLMVKTLDENASYQPSYRSLNWLKLKKDYLDGMGDSLDLVPIGAYYGRGKRTGVYGAYLLACYDLDSEEYQSVCKIGTGFSDEDLKTLSKVLNERVITEKNNLYKVSKSLECDVWFEACQVWEVKAADLSKSSTHKGAIDKTGDNGRGIGLRFPRFERLRDDKKPEHATSSDQILEMYYAQDSVTGNGKGKGHDGGI